MNMEQQKGVDSDTKEFAEEPAPPELLKELYDLAILTGVDKIPRSEEVWLELGGNLKIRLSPKDNFLHIQFSASHPSYMSEQAFRNSSQAPICGGCKFTSEWGIRPDGSFIMGSEHVDSWSEVSHSLVRTQSRQNPRRTESLDSPPAISNIREIIDSLKTFAPKVITRETESAVKKTLS